MKETRQAIRQKIECNTDNIRRKEESVKIANKILDYIAGQPNGDNLLLAALYALYRCKK